MADHCTFCKLQIRKRPRNKISEGNADFINSCKCRSTGVGCLLAQSGGVVAQMVERSLSIQKVQGLIAHIFADHTVYGHFM